MLSLEWAAGFFEGEGNATVRKHNKADKIYPCLTLQLSQVDRRPLDEFVKIVGGGKVRGPYGPYGTTKQAYYQYAISGKDAIPVAESLIPLMFAKGEQVQIALNKYKEYLIGK